MVAKPASTSRLEWVLRRTRMHTIVGVGVARLSAGLAGGRIRELWVGDSHSVLLNTDRFPLWMAPADDGRFIWHLGPRIMHSVATNGFPPVLERVLRGLGRLPASRRLTVLISFGEIDVRCHLADRLGEQDPAWVRTYVERAVALADGLGAAHVVIVAPPPPSDSIADHVMFPISGDLAARTAAQTWLYDALAAAVAARADRRGPRVSLLEVGRALADAEGHMRADLTDDGCHTNAAGRAAVRQLVREHLDSHPTQPEERTR